MSSRYRGNAITPDATRIATLRHTSRYDISHVDVTQGNAITPDAAFLGHIAMTYLPEYVGPLMGPPRNHSKHVHAGTQTISNRCSPARNQYQTSARRHEIKIRQVLTGTQTMSSKCTPARIHALAGTI